MPILPNAREAFRESAGEYSPGIFERSTRLAKVTIAFGALMIVLGIAGFVATGSEHYTALIPTWFGIALGIAGGVALNPKLRMHAMHGAAMIGLLGLFGTISGVIKLIKWGFGTEPARPAAAISQSIMAILCAIFVALCVNSFIAARRARQSAPGFPVQ